MRRLIRPTTVAAASGVAMLIAGFGAASAFDPVGDSVLSNILATEIKNLYQLTQISTAAAGTLKNTRDAVAMALQARDIVQGVLSMDGQRMQAILTRAIDSSSPDAAYLRAVVQSGGRGVIPVAGYGSLDYLLVQCATNQYACSRFGVGSQACPAGAQEAAQRDCEELRNNATGLRYAQSMAVAYGLDPTKLDPGVARAMTAATVAAQTSAAQQANQTFDKKMAIYNEWKKTCEGQGQGAAGGISDACRALAEKAKVYGVMESAETNEDLRQMKQVAAEQLALAAAEHQGRLDAATGDRDSATVYGLNSMQCILTGTCTGPTQPPTVSVPATVTAPASPSPASTSASVAASH